MTDPKAFEKKFEKRGKEIYLSAASLADGSAAYVSASDGKIYRYDARDEKAERIALEGDGHASFATGVTLAGDTLVSVGYDRRLIFWNVAEGRQTRVVEGAHEKWIRGVVAWPDGSRVVTVADDMQAKVWDVATGEAIATFSDHEPITPNHFPSMLFVAALSADGSRIATADKVGHVALWNAETYEQSSELKAPGLYTWDPRARVHSIGGVRSLAFSPDGSRLAVGGVGEIGNVDHLDGKARIEIFDVASGERTRLIEDDKKKGLVEKLVWSADGAWLLAGGGVNDGFLSFWSPDSGELLQQYDVGSHVHDVAFASDGAAFCVAAHERIEFWGPKAD